MASASYTPTLGSVYRRRHSLDRPPVRHLNSPPLTAEEIDLLTGPNLNYTTGYTYANSLAYDPDKPPTWEVPNLINTKLSTVGTHSYSVDDLLVASILCQAAQKGVDCVLDALNALLWILWALTVLPAKTVVNLIYNTVKWTLNTVVHGFWMLSRFFTREHHEFYSERYNRIALERLEREGRNVGGALEKDHGGSLYGRSNLRKRTEDGFLLSSSDGANDESRMYNLRSRLICAESDSENEAPSMRRSSNLRRDKTGPNGSARGGQTRTASKSYFVATWLGRKASSLVYYPLSLLYFTGACSAKLFDAVRQTFSHDFIGLFPLKKREMSSMRLRSGYRYVPKASARQSALLNRNLMRADDENSIAGIMSPYISYLQSFCSNLLYAPCAVFLFLMFAAADLCRWMWSKIAPLFQWLFALVFAILRCLWNICKTVLCAPFKIPRRYLWLGFPLLLFIVVIWDRLRTGEPLIMLTREAAELKEQVFDYAYNILSGDGVYAKSINSIYDEYWLSGKVSCYDFLSKATSAVWNGYLFIATSIVSACNFLATSVGDMAFHVVDFFATESNDAYTKLPEVESWKSLAAGVLTSAEEYLFMGMSSLSQLLSTVFRALCTSCYAIWEIIMALLLMAGNAFRQSFVTVIDQQPYDSKAETQANIFNPAVPAIDETKLIEKISTIVHAKMDRDLKMKLEAELKALSESYEQKISTLKQEKDRLDVDYSHLESLIRAAIYKYDSDKTGMFDFALESAGASIISTRCSENYDTFSRLEKIWNIPLWYSSYGPRTVIQRNSKTLFPGECWSFKGPVGYITIGLSHPINVTIVSYEHIGAHQAPGGERPSAPRTFKIWAYKTESDMNTRFLLGDFIYDINDNPLQFFFIKEQPDYPVKIIEMEVTSNYGAPYTSLYRLRVHGSLYKPGVN